MSGLSGPPGRHRAHRTVQVKAGDSEGTATGDARKCLHLIRLLKRCYFSEETLSLPAAKLPRDSFRSEAEGDLCNYPVGADDDD